MPMQATTTTPLFAAELTPHRGLDRRGLWLVAGLTVLLLAAPALLLLPLGIGPVILLMAAIGLALASGLYFGLRRGKQRERITVWADQIEWQVTDSLGATTLRRFDPGTARLMLTRDEFEKTVAVQLRDESGGYELGAFLSLEDKSSFAKALGTALRRARS